MSKTGIPGPGFLGRTRRRTSDYAAGVFAFWVNKARETEMIKERIKNTLELEKKQIAESKHLT